MHEIEGVRDKMDRASELISEGRKLREDIGTQSEEQLLDSMKRLLQLNEELAGLKLDFGNAFRSCVSKLSKVCRPA